MIPSKDQYKKWSLPSKVGYVSFVLAVVGLVLTIAFWYWPKSAPSDTDEYVRRTNPVKLTLEDVTVQRWLGDEQDALTVAIKNEATVPVDGVEFALGDEGRDVPQFLSYQMRNFTQGVSIEAGKEAVVPVAGIREIESIVSGTVCGASVRHPELGQPFPGCGKDWSHLKSYMFTLRLRYKTIFDEQRRDEFKLWVFVIPESVS